MSFLSTAALAVPAAAEDIRDIRGPLTIVPWWRWPLVVAAAVVVLVAVALAVRAYRARMLRAFSPLDRARQALARAEEHAREGRSRDWADLVAETTRAALAAKLGAQVLPQTTAELAVIIRSQAPIAGATVLEERDVTELLALLESCDLARFAKASLGPGDLAASTAMARALVERLYAPATKKPAAAAAGSRVSAPTPTAPPSAQQVTT